MSINDDMKDYFRINEIKAIFENEIKFKLKLNLTENTYKYLSNAKNLEKFSAALAAGLAGAAGGYLAWLVGLGFFGKLGVLLGLVANPIGWIALAGAGGAVLMYGGKTLIDKFDREAHDKIPKFLNTPLDYLGQNIINIILPIAIKISIIDSKITEEDKKVIIDEYKNWGYDEDYLIKEINEINQYISSLTIIDTKKKLEAICNEVDGLSYSHLKKIIEESLSNIFKQKIDKNNFLEYTKYIQML